VFALARVAGASLQNNFGHVVLEAGNACSCNALVATRNDDGPVALLPVNGGVYAVHDQVSTGERVAHGKVALAE